MLIARFDGDVQELIAAYDKAHLLIMSRGGAVPSGELSPDAPCNSAFCRS
jgi:hypothetical protein